MKFLWKLPFPSSGLGGVRFLDLGRREYCLRLVEGFPADPEAPALHFIGVVSYKGTHQSAVEGGLISATYDTLVDFGDTPWLRSGKDARGLDGRTTALRHLGIYFDDEWLHEFLCSDYRLVGFDSDV